MGTKFWGQNGHQFLGPNREPVFGSKLGTSFWVQIWPQKLVRGNQIFGISGCAVWGFFGSEKWQIWATRGRRKECARWALREALGAPLPERAPTVCGARGGRGLILSARTLQLILWRAAFVETLALCVCVCVCVYERRLQPTSPRPFDKMRCDYSRSTHHCVAVATWVLRGRQSAVRCIRKQHTIAVTARPCQRPHHEAFVRGHTSLSQFASIQLTHLQLSDTLSPLHTPSTQFHHDTTHAALV